MADLEGRRWIPPCLPGWAGSIAGMACETIAKLTGKQWFIDRDFVHYFSKAWHVDGSKARSELGFSHTPLREGLRRYIDWAKDAGLV
jgi:nucleoside-diphosphate-sugar epimerase